MATSRTATDFLSVSPLALKGFPPVVLVGGVDGLFSRRTSVLSDRVVRMRDLG